jgi:hypothetical protein
MISLLVVMKYFPSNRLRKSRTLFPQPAGMRILPPFLLPPQNLSRRGPGHLSVLHGNFSVYHDIADPFRFAVRILVGGPVDDPLGIENGKLRESFFMPGGPCVFQKRFKELSSYQEKMSRILLVTKGLPKGGFLPPAYGWYIGG